MASLSVEDCEHGAARLKRRSGLRKRDGHPSATEDESAHGEGASPSQQPEPCGSVFEDDSKPYQNLEPSLTSDWFSGGQNLNHSYRDSEEGQYLNLGNQGVEERTKGSFRDDDLGGVQDVPSTNGTAHLSSSLARAVEDLDNLALTLSDSGSEGDAESSQSDEDETMVKQPSTPEQDIPACDRQDLMALIQTLRQEQAELRKSMESQRQEQERLKQQQAAHERHLAALVRKTPSFRSRIRSVVIAEHFSQGLLARRAAGHDPPLRPHRSQRGQAVVTESERIYVQFEELYRNWHRLHMYRLQPDSDEEIYSEIGDPLATVELRGQDRRPSHNDKPQLRKSEEDPRRHKSRRRGVCHSRSFTAMDRAQRQSRVSGLYADVEDTSRMSGRPLPALPSKAGMVPSRVEFKWNIPKFFARFSQEKQVAGTKSETPPFYLFHQGYRARLEAYLNGNGASVNNAMSVFLRVIPGQFDHTLPWPLDVTLTFILIDQSDNSRQQSLKSVPTHRKCFSFRRPESCEENQSDAWGLVQFIRHEVLSTRTFVKNDTIQLLCKLKFENSNHFGVVDLPD